MKGVNRGIKFIPYQELSNYPELNYQLTVFGGGNIYLDTQYGYIPFLDWLIKEREKFINSGRKAEIVKSGNSYALFVNKVS